ncbi:hypothetical protein LZZ85_00240 [Terrimonas sp. NA20]|uniref:TIGR02646 family protein n=1 Tax=Terrimonas ginsenosidimutans TaxID=2908004 RepID=A0ABS9KK29_9BACT|nr:hypothetical protein [Terrimonas ginsenosidimutans]MCG2612678.1 hypothetical protein [Terrimonas ginsenosidimutans]
MRKLDRSRIPIPLSLTDPLQSGITETTLAIKFFTSKRVNGKFTYKAYQAPEVKKAVSDLCYDKCAYCESLVLAIDDGDVEHFRPKGEVTLDDSTSLKPGYYWLAATWENLFLSCKHCNQARKQPTPSGAVTTLGKKNQFPLSDNRKRIRSHNRKINLEEPYRLLINPCLEDPLKFLEFTKDGLVYPIKKTNAVIYRKAEVSIEVFALLRKKLVEARAKQALTVLSALETLDGLINLVNSGGITSAAMSNAQKLLQDHIKGLKKFTQPGQLFSGMSLSLIQKHLKKAGISFRA